MFPFCEANVSITANLGGGLGVCLGASLLTLVEFIEFSILSIAHVLCYKRPGQVQTTSSTGEVATSMNSQR